MLLAPLLEASPAIQLHAFAAMSAVVLGAVQLAGPKGTLPHRLVGSVWVALKLIVSISAFLKVWGSWSPIHLLAIFTLVMLPIAVWRAHTHAVAQHWRAMQGLYLGALIVAGLFAFWPGRHHACRAVQRDEACAVRGDMI